MRKLLALLVLCVCLGLAGVLVLFGLLHTQYATPIINALAPKLLDTPIHVDSVEYQSPYHLSLHGVEISTQPEPLYIENIQLWLNQDLIEDRQLAVDSLLLSGFSLQQGVPEFHWPKQIKLHQLAIDHFDFSQQELVVRELAIQVKNPQPNQDGLLPWHGEWQASAEQIYWQGEAVDKVLLDADYLSDAFKIYGLSFRWQGAHFTTQADQIDDGWRLLNASINNLKLNQAKLNALESKLDSSFAQLPFYIERLDLLNANVELAGVQTTQADITIEDWDMEQPLWQQQSQFSLNAESVIWQEQQWIEPVFNAELSDGTLFIDDLSTRVQQGFIQFSGQFTPSSAKFNHLTLSGLEWLAQTSDQSLIAAMPDWQDIKIKRLLVRNSQYVNLEQEPKHQISGINITGSSLSLRKAGHWGLMDGDLRLSVNSMNYGKLIAAQSLLEAHASEGTSYLDKLVIPLNEGLIRAQGEWQFDSLSQPWQLKMAADGFPLDLVSLSQLSEFKFIGAGDIEFDLNGLSGDYSMFAHSLAGFVNLSLPDAMLSAEKVAPLMGKNIEKQLSFNHIKLLADRGRITLQSSEFTGDILKGKLAGQLDLTAQPKSNLAITIQGKDTQGKCAEWQKLLIQQTEQLQSKGCPTTPN